jgi:hypothetical protein
MANIFEAGRRLIGQALFGSAAAAPGSEQPRRNIVQETPPHSDEESSSLEESTPAIGNPIFSFKVETSAVAVMNGENGRDHYLTSVLNWATVGSAGRLRMNQVMKGVDDKSSTISASLHHVSIGSYTVQEVTSLIQNAADSAGFSLYSHKGARVHGNRCTIKFGCDHGRKRYGKDAVRDLLTFEKDLDTVVSSSCRKKRTTRPNHGYNPALTKRSRLKSTDCNFQFSIISYQVDTSFKVETHSTWHLSSHGKCSHNFNHNSHTFRGTRILLHPTAKQYVLDHCHLHAVQTLSVQLQRIYNLDISINRVRWIINTNGKASGTDRAVLEGQSGAAAASIRQLLQTKNSMVVMLLINITDGQLFTAKATLSSSGKEVQFEKNIYKDRDGGRMIPMQNPDVDRVIHIDGDCFFVHTQVWNYLDDLKLFAAYSQALAMDAQANVNRSTDGFNVVGICGNYHNIVVLRSFIGDQTAQTFRWMFHVAFLYLLGKPLCLRVTTILVDGCTAVLGELQVCCSPGGTFGNAKILRCIFHLFIDAWDRKFGFAMKEPWFQEYKSHLFQLKNCESQEEFEEYSNYVLRKAAGCEDDTFPNISVMKFIMARVKNEDAWVLYAHINVCTRGCSSSSRCESEHGHSRNAGVNARCSWCLTITRYENIRSARKQRLLRWINRQLDGTLARGPTNASETTLSLEHLSTLDGELLPWMLDTIEEQALLGRVSGLRCDYIERTAEGKHVFAVYFEDDGVEEVAAPDRYRSEPRNSDSDNDGGDEDGDSEDSGKRSRDEDTDTEQWTVDMQKELERLSEIPLEQSTKFVYKKIRRVAIRKDPKDASRVMISCSCGFQHRIGCACRHIFCALFTILKAKPVSLEYGATIVNLCRCTSAPVACEACIGQPHYRKFEWGQFDLLNLVNLDIGSKLKYHAALHPTVDASKLFPEQNVCRFGSFWPRIPGSIMSMFGAHNDPVNPRLVPKSGLPEGQSRHDQEEEEDASPPPTQPHARRRIREEVPTLFKAINDIERIWSRTDRLKNSRDAPKKTEARVLIRTTLRSLEEAIIALHPDFAPKRTERFYSKRDYYIGKARRAAADQ